jgi:hypothetical protein
MILRLLLLLALQMFAIQPAFKTGFLTADS